MVLTLFGMINLAIFIICLIPYWKDYPDYISFPVSIMGASFFLLFLNELIGFSNQLLLMSIHLYLWIFAFAFTFFMYYKKIQPMILYSTMIFFPPAMSALFGLEFIQAVGAVGYLVVASLFYQLLMESKKIFKYSAIIGISSSIILMFNSLVCIGCTNMLTPYSLLALSFSLWISGFQTEQLIA